MLDKTNEASLAGDVTDREILTTIERVERLHEERKAIASDIADIFTEAKGKGLNVKVLKALIKERAQDESDLREFETVAELYRAALVRART